MKTKTTDKTSDEGLVAAISEITISKVSFFIVRTSPLVLHAMSAKGAQDLLFPYKKNATERATTLKHNPLQEFRDAAYTFLDSDATPTRLYMPAGAFHGALASVAIDMAGARKSQVARLTKVQGSGGQDPCLGGAAGGVPDPAFVGHEAHARCPHAADSPAVGR